VYHATVDVGRHGLRVGQDELSVREATTASVLTRSRSNGSHRNRQSVCWQCGGTNHLTRLCSRRTAKNVTGKRYWKRN
jgi:hypothetical protein